MREKRGYTQQQLAGMLEIGRDAVSKWERGINTPCRKHRQKLCRILNCTEAELTAGDQEIIQEGEEIVYAE